MNSCLFLYCTYPLHTIHTCMYFIFLLVPSLSVAEVVSVSNDSISLTWNSTDADDFVVYYKERTASTVYNATTTVSEYNISDLVPFTLYHVTVSGRSVLGETTTTVGSRASVVRTTESGKLSVFYTLVMMHVCPFPILITHCEVIQIKTMSAQLPLPYMDRHHWNHNNLSCTVKPPYYQHHWDHSELSCLWRCPYFRGFNCRHVNVRDFIINGVLFKEVSASQRCPSNRNLLSTVRNFKPVLICTIIFPTVCIMTKIIYSIIILHVLCNLIYSFVLWFLLSTYIYIHCGT